MKPVTIRKTVSLTVLTRYLGGAIHHGGGSTSTNDNMDCASASLALTSGQSRRRDWLGERCGRGEQEGSESEER